MKFNLVSDLHIDFDRARQLDLPGGDILLLAGDLCEVGDLNPRYRRDLALASLTATYDIESMNIKLEKEVDRKLELLDRIKIQLARYNQVYAVLGNHEHYNCNFDLTAELYKEVLPEVILLENESISLSDNLVLFGATLWTDLDRGNPLVECLVKAWSDYEWITVGPTGRKLRSSDTLNAHQKSIAALYRCIDDNPGKDILVMTHFVPSSRSSHERYKMNMDNYFFYSSLDEIMLEYPNIKAWCHGHTHNNYDYKIGECRVMCNPRGYVQGFQSEKTGFDPGFNFEL